MEGNPELLRRAIENIVRNAIRYSPEGGRVQVSLKRPGTLYRIAVRDFGAGVPDEALAHLFDPFYRVEKDRGRTSGGVGLGLAIAKRAVELHHGTMRASNQRPGLLVEIELPAPAVAPERTPVLSRPFPDPIIATSLAIREGAIETSRARRHSVHVDHRS